jgi:hypothetical protein
VSIGLVIGLGGALALTKLLGAVIFDPTPNAGIVLLVGRAGHPFRRRERRQLLALARIADRLAAIIP